MTNSADTLVDSHPIRVMAYQWSTSSIRWPVEVIPGEYEPRNERAGCEGERVVDYGLWSGLIISTHWGLTPFGKAIS